MLVAVVVFTLCVSCAAKFASDVSKEPVGMLNNSHLPMHMARNTTGDGPLQTLEFAASNEHRNFHIRLHPMATVAVVSSATNVSTVSAGEGRKPVDVVARLAARLWKRYGGHIEDDPQSTVSGHLVRGLFNGFVKTANETYFVEPADDVSPREYNAILYKSSDTDVCPKNDDRGNSTGGDSSQLLAGLHEDLMAMTPHLCHLSRRTRRQASNVKKLKVTSFLCDLRVICDFRWYRYVAFRNTTYGTELVVSMLRHVDQIFRSLDLDGDGLSENVGFYLRYLDIYMDPVMPGYEEVEHWHAPRFFEEFGAYDFGDVCAGLLFTYRELSHDRRHSDEFPMPTIPKTNIRTMDQGICSQYVPAKGPTKMLSDYGEFVANALPINFMSPHHRVASASSIVVETAHQLGHLFGASDDADTKDARCQPDEDDPRRNYIMAYPLVSADVELNFKFSPCSRTAVQRFLQSLEKQERSCLKPCRNPTRCLTDSWNIVTDDDDEHHGDGLRPRASDAKGKQGGGGGGNQTGSASTASEGADTTVTTTVTTESATESSTTMRTSLEPEPSETTMPTDADELDSTTSEDDEDSGDDVVNSAGKSIVISFDFVAVVIAIVTLVPF